MPSESISHEGAQKEEGSEIPCVWVISPTSNLFAVGVDLYVMKRDETAMLAVLRGEGAEDSVLVESGEQEG